MLKITLSSALRNTPGDAWGTVRDAEDRTQQHRVQGKRPAHCTISPTPEGISKSPPRPTAKGRRTERSEGISQLPGRRLFSLDGSTLPPSAGRCWNRSSQPSLTCNPEAWCCPAPSSLRQPFCRILRHTRSVTPDTPLSPRPCPSVLGTQAHLSAWSCRSFLLIYSPRASAIPPALAGPAANHLLHVPLSRASGPAVGPESGPPVRTFWTLAWKPLRRLHLIIW